MLRRHPSDIEECGGRSGTRYRSLPHQTSPGRRAPKARLLMDPRLILQRRPWRRMAGATLGVAAVLVTSCDRPSPTQSPALTGAPRRVTALVGHAVRTLAVTVRAGDLPTPLVFNLPGPDGVATGTITIPFGPARTIDVTALDVTGGVTQEGSVTLTVAPGPQPTVAIALTPRPDDGSPPITVILADYGVVVTPSTAMIDGAVARTRQFTATVTDVNGDTVAA